MATYTYPKYSKFLLIDYTKILINGIDAERLLNSEELEFKTEVSEKTGVLSTKHIAKYHFCKITINDSGLIIFSGSIHKYWNSKNKIYSPNFNPKIHKNYKGFNGNQFNLDNILEVRNDLTNLFECTPEQLEFQNIEFGVNTEPSFEPKLFLKGLLFHTGKGFEYRYNNHYAQVTHQQYRIKLYDKGKQYGMTKETLRVEIKINKSDYLKKSDHLKSLHIKTFADINEETLDNAKKHLLMRFNEIVYYDYTITQKGLPKSCKEKLKIFSNPRFWLYTVDPNHRDRPKKKLSKLITDYSHNLQKIISNEIIKKCVTINRQNEDSKCVINNTSSIGISITQSSPSKQPENSERICLVTGLDISMQKDSILLSHTGLNYYYNKDKNTFDEIKCEFLSNKWQNDNHEKQVIEIAHNIRNKMNSIRMKQERLYPASQVCLF